MKYWRISLRKISHASVYVEAEDGATEEDVRQVFDEACEEVEYDDLWEDDAIEMPEVEQFDPGTASRRRKLKTVITASATP